MKIGTRETVRAIDKFTIEKYCVPGIVLMENAGRAAADVILEEYPESGSVAIFAGGGNNGGDGFVIARHLIGQGLDVTVYLASEIKKYSGDAETNLKALTSTGADVIELKGNLRRYRQADLIVDSLLGTGLDREVEGFYRKIIKFINAQDAPCVAVDIPSGLDADTGLPLGEAVLADVTVTFVMPKLGMCTYPGAEFCGKLYSVDITTPKFLEENIYYDLLTAEDLSPLLEPRYPDTHKGTYGHLFILAGSPGKSGAAALSSLGALRSGAGLVTVGIPESLNGIMEQKTTEAMTVPIPETENHTFGIVSLLKALETLGDRKSALAIGPGITTGEDAREFLYEIITQCDVPMVIDADGITLVAENPSVLNKAKAPVVLTPHPGEMARLSGIDTSDVQRDRINVASEFSKKYKVYTVLKGSRTVISTPEGRIFINTTGNAGMATGGTGDVLTGVIGGLLAQGYEPGDACTLGVYVHGLAGDLAAGEIGEAGIIAGDLADLLPEAIALIPEIEEEPVIRIR